MAGICEGEHLGLGMRDSPHNLWGTKEKFLFLVCVFETFLLFSSLSFHDAGGGL